MATTAAQPKEEEEEKKQKPQPTWSSLQSCCWGFGICLNQEEEDRRGGSSVLAGLALCLVVVLPQAVVLIWYFTRAALAQVVTKYQEHVMIVLLRQLLLGDRMSNFSWMFHHVWHAVMIPCLAWLAFWRWAKPAEQESVKRLSQHLISSRLLLPQRRKGQQHHRHQERCTKLVPPPGPAAVQDDDEEIGQRLLERVVPHDMMNHANDANDDDDNDSGVSKEQMEEEGLLLVLVLRWLYLTLVFPVLVHTLFWASAPAVGICLLPLWPLIFDTSQQEGGDTYDHSSSNMMMLLFVLASLGQVVALVVTARMLNVATSSFLSCRKTRRGRGAASLCTSDNYDGSQPATAI